VKGWKIGRGWGREEGGVGVGPEKEGQTVKAPTRYAKFLLTLCTFHTYCVYTFIHCEYALCTLAFMETLYRNHIERCALCASCESHKEFSGVEHMSDRGRKR
jgi:hypothetical protein